VQARIHWAKATEGRDVRPSLCRVLVSGGDVRLRRGNDDVDVPGLKSGSPSVVKSCSNGPVVQARATISTSASVATELWATWADIAIEQAALARRARAAWVAQREAGAEWDMNTELHPAMISIAAAATSLDGFATLVEQAGVTVQAPPAPPGGQAPGRAAWIWETLRAGFAVGRHTNSWPRDIKDLFALRNVRGGGLLHPQTIFTDASSQHPVLPGVSAARVFFTTENADKAVALMRAIYGECRTAVRPQHAELQARMGGIDGVLARLTTEA
jgi:hypothetical protein